MRRLIHAATTMLTVGILLLCNVVAQQTPASNHNPATAAKTATTAKPHAAVSEEAEWNRALQLNSEAGYMDFYKKFPNTGRLACFMHERCRDGLLGTTLRRWC